MTQVARRYLSDLKLGGKWIPMPSSLGIYVNVDEFFTWTPLLIGSREITEIVILVPASAPRLVYQRPWYVRSCMWDGAYKTEPLLLIGKVSPCSGGIGFPLSLSEWSFTNYVRRTITVNKMCCVRR